MSGGATAVLLFNTGSSSLKAEIRAVRSGSAAEIVAGAAVECGSGDFTAATREVMATLETQLGGGVALAAAVVAVGHRVVHGGERFRTTTRIDASVIAALEALVPLAPLHNPAALATIRASSALLPAAVPAYAVFDTAFFAALPEHVVRYPLPRALLERSGVRRFGFHGLAHQAMLDALAALMPCNALTRVISLQLGQGCSVTASRGGQPIDTSMGFTPLGGLIMGTRPGDLDPGALLYLLRHSDLSATDLEHELNVHAGLLALSGVSGDMRELLRLEATGHAGARLAITAFCQRARQCVGGFLAELGGAEAILFGGGIGENSAEIRRRICNGLEVFGVGRNIPVHVIRVDEAAVMAREVVATAGLTSARSRLPVQ